MDDTRMGDGVYLRTARLVLRRFTMADVDALMALDSDPEVMRFITGGAPTPRQEISDDVLPAWLAYYDRGPAWGFWAAEQRTTGEFLGWFHLRPPRDRSTADPELGYRLHRRVWGQGYATEGSIALVDKAFGELGAQRVFAETMAINTASRRVMEKAGLRFVRTFHADWPVSIPGDEHGDVEYAITRDEWLEERAAEGRSPTSRSRRRSSCWRRGRGWTRWWWPGRRRPGWATGRRCRWCGTCWPSCAS